MGLNVKKIGLSRFVLGSLTSFIIGLYFGNIIVLPFLVSLIIIVLVISSGYYFRKNKLVLLLTISIGALIFGLTYYHFWDWRENKKIVIYNQKSEVEGIVKQVEEKEKYQQIILQYQNTKLLIQAPKFPEFNYGDKLKMTGEIQNPKDLKFTDFDYGNYLLKKGIRGLIKTPEKIEKIGWDGNKITAEILNIGNSFQTMLNRLLPEPLSTLMIGLLVGLKQQLPDSLTSAFQRTGLSHITAVSGYNVTIIIIWVSFLLMLISRKVSFVGTIIATLLFIVLTGASASVIRAGVLAILILISQNIGRRPYYPILILFAAFIMLLFNPYALKNDLSFQLSFLAFIGLLILSTPIGQIRIFQIIPEGLRKVVAETLGAQILVLPILVYNFGIVSLIAPLANVLILPIIPFTMLLGFIAGLSGIILYDLGKLLSDVAYLPLKYIIVAVESLSRVSWAAVTLNYKVWWWIPLYYLLIWSIVKVRTNAQKQ